MSYEVDPDPQVLHDCRSCPPKSSARTMSHHNRTGRRSVDPDVEARQPVFVARSVDLETPAVATTSQRHARTDRDDDRPVERDPLGRLGRPVDLDQLFVHERRQLVGPGPIMTGRPSASSSESLSRCGSPV